MPLRIYCERTRNSAYLIMTKVWIKYLLCRIPFCLNYNLYCSGFINWLPFSPVKIFIEKKFSSGNNKCWFLLRRFEIKKFVLTSFHFSLEWGWRFLHIRLMGGLYFEFEIEGRIIEKEYQSIKFGSMHNLKFEEIFLCFWKFWYILKSVLHAVKTK